jgi:hypothetical protein
MHNFYRITAGLIEIVSHLIFQLKARMKKNGRTVSRPLFASRA